MPGFQHSCFISYKHPLVHDKLQVHKHYWMEFVTAFQEKLENYLTVGLSTYRDEDLRAQPGIRYPAELARNLCQSVCMIAILVPEYMESDWCVGEWRGMQELERMRNVGAGDFIIPVLFRGDPERTREFVGSRLFIDFRHIYRPRTDLNTRDSRRTLENIAERVADLAKQISPSDCNAFVIDVGEDVAKPRLDDPSPLV